MPVPHRRASRAPLAEGRFAASLLALAMALLAVLPSRGARADPVKVDDGQHGLVVLGLGRAIDVAWPLARAVYADASLRPTSLDEAHARVLVGEPAGDDRAAELRDLGDLRAAIHGDDGASRRLLESIALSLHVKGIVVVEAGATPRDRPAARVFVTTTQGYDAVRYEPDPSPAVTWGAGAVAALTWNGTVQALRRSFADAPPPSPPPPAPPPSAAPLALHALPTAAPAEGAKPAKRAFYQSPWFWAAAGAAVFAAGAVYLATRNDETSSNIQLQVQVPK